MNQSASQMLLAVLLAAAVLGLLVLLTVPDYREGFIIESNRGYMPAVRVESEEVALPSAPAEPATPSAVEAATPAAGAQP